MKKIILSITLIIAVQWTLYAQALYVGGGIGPGFRAGSKVFGVSTNKDGSVDVVKGSDGSGLIAPLYVGYMSSKNVGLELGIGSFIGYTNKLNDPYNTGTTSFSGNSLFLNPSFVIRTGGEKIAPYVKLGVFLGLVNNSITQYDPTSTDPYVTTQETITYKKGMATGVTSSLGLDIKISRKWVLFGEMFTRLASYSPKKYSDETTTENYSPGSGSYTKTTTVVNGNLVTHLPPDYSANGDRAAIVVPFSTIGFNLGLKCYIFKK